MCLARPQSWSGGVRGGGRGVRTELGDLASEQLDTLGGVAEDDGLVDLELGEQRVEAVHLLAFFDKGVELCHTLEGQRFHKIDLVPITGSQA